MLFSGLSFLFLAKKVSLEGSENLCFLGIRSVCVVLSLAVQPLTHTYHWCMLTHTNSPDVRSQFFTIPSKWGKEKLETTVIALQNSLINISKISKLCKTPKLYKH